MIPHVIHYCWFGGSPLDPQAQRCIESWKRYLPGWQIQEWNEQNFDVHGNMYAEEAYREKKWAFVSDYARLAILAEHGGIYMDTDVELIRDITDLVEQGSFMGIESCGRRWALVNPGMLTAAEPHNPVIEDVLRTYEGDHFSGAGVNGSGYTIVRRTSQILRDKYHLKASDTVQRLEGITIYPTSYFCPMDYRTGEVRITEDTRSIHWYAATWLEKRQRKRHARKQDMLRRLPAPLARPAVFFYGKAGALGDLVRAAGIRGLLRRVLRGRH